MNVVRDSYPIPWYTDPAAYRAIRERAADPETLPPSYASWVAKTIALEETLLRQGYNVVRVPIQPEQFWRWCARTGRVPDREAREAYARELIS